MREALISVAEAAQDLRKLVGRARAESVSFVMTDNGVPVARIVPEEPPVCTGLDLAAALAAGQLEPRELAAWRSDVNEGRDALVPPPIPWA